MTRLLFPENAFNDLATATLPYPVETCAVLFTEQVVQGSSTRLLVADTEIAPDHAYTSRSGTAATLTSSYVLDVTNRARLTGRGLVFAHTHPGSVFPDFSPADDEGERLLEPFLLSRSPSGTHLALVIGSRGCSCRRIASKAVPVIQVGTTLQRVDRSAVDDADVTFDRQVRALGKAGQALLSRLTVGIVGLGGTGSLIAQFLAYLGIRSFVLIDPDTVELHSLNRLAGAGREDVGSAKIAVAQRHIQFIRNESNVTAVQADILNPGVIRNLLDVDFVFCCTDSHASRAALNQFAYQYLVPCIDMGVSIEVSKAGQLDAITGRVQMLAPGLACLTCTNALDTRQIRADLMTSEQRSLDPYFLGPGEPQPSVISLNGTVASLAASMFLSAAASVPGDARLQIYNAIKGTVRPMLATPQANCVVCSRSGALVRGDKWPLPTRLVIQ